MSDAQRARFGRHDALLWNAAASGVPLVLLHGFAGSPAVFDELAATLVARDPGRGPIVALALPGHAPDTPAEPALGWDGALDALQEALDALTRGPVQLAGYSLGARVALGLVARDPERIERAVLVSVNPGLDDAAARSERRAADARWAALLRTGGLDAFLAAWEAQPLFASQRALDPARRAGQSALRLAHDPEQLARSLELLGLAEMPAYGTALPRVTVPVTFAAGTLDTKFAALARAAAASVPGARLELVDGCGHNLVLEAPERLAQMVTVTISSQKR